MSRMSETRLAPLAVVVACLMAILLVDSEVVRGVLAAGVVIAYFAYETRSAGLSRWSDKTERSAGWRLGQPVILEACVGFLALGVAMGSWMALGAAGVDRVLAWVASLVVGLVVLRLVRGVTTQAMNSESDTH